MSSVEEPSEAPLDSPEDPRDFSNIKSVETTTNRLIVYNSTDARERLSSTLTLPVEP